MTEYTLSLTILGKDKASGLFDRLDRSLKSVMQTAMGMTLARVFEDIGAAIGRMAINAINAVSYVQNLEVVLGSLIAREMYMTGEFDNVGAAMGNADIAAQQLMHDLGRFAILSPYTMEATTNMFRLMMAFGSTSEQSTLLTRGLMTMGAGLGASNEQIQRMAYNLAQIQLEGKVTALDIRQLALAGLPLNDVLKSVGKQFGVNIENHQDFNKALAEGKITWQQFTEGFAKYADENFGGASERMARTLSGLKSTFSDVFTLTMPQILGPAVEEITGVMSTLLDAFLYIYEDPRLKQIGVELGAKVRGWIAPVKGAVETFSAALAGGADIGTAVKQLFGDLGTIFKDTSKNILGGLALSLPGVTTWAADLVTRIFTGLATNLPKIGIFITQVLGGVLASLTTAAPGLIASFGAVWLSLGQTLITAAPGILSSVTSLIGQIATGFVNNAPQIAAAAENLVMTLTESMSQNMPTVLNAAGAIVMTMLSGIGEHMPRMITAGMEIITQFVNGLAQMMPEIIATAGIVLAALVRALLQGLPELLLAGARLVVGVALGLVAALPDLINAVMTFVPAIIVALLQSLPMLVDAGLQLLLAIALGLVSALTTITNSADQIINELMSALAAMLPQILIVGVQIITMLVMGILQNLPALLNAAVSLVMQLIALIEANLPLLIVLGMQLLTALLIGIVQALPGIVDVAIRLVQDLLNNIGMWLPMLLQLGATLLLTLAQGILLSLPAIASAGIDIVVSLLEAIYGLLSAVFQAGADLMSAFETGFRTGDWSGVDDFFTGLFDGSRANLQLTGFEWGNQLRAGLKASLPGLETTVQNGVAGINAAIASDPTMNMQSVGAQFATNMGYGWASQYPSMANTLTTDFAGLTTGFGLQTIGMQGVGTDLAANIGTGWSSTISDTRMTIDDDLGLIPLAVGNNLKGTTTSAGAGLATDIGEGFDAEFPGVKSSLVADVADLSKVLKPGDTTSIGSNIIGGIRGGLEGAFPGLKARARQMAKEIADAMSVALEIRSPSKVFSRIGEQIPRGLAQGITRREQLPLEAAVRMAELLNDNSRVKSAADLRPNKVYNYSLTMPTSSNPNDIRTAFELMEAWNV